MIATIAIVNNAAKVSVWDGPINYSRCDIVLSFMGGIIASYSRKLRKVSLWHRLQILFVKQK